MCDLQYLFFGVVGFGFQLLQRDSLSVGVIQYNILHLVAEFTCQFDKIVFCHTVRVGKRLLRDDMPVRALSADLDAFEPRVDRIPVDEIEQRFLPVVEHLADAVAYGVFGDHRGVENEIRVLHLRHIHRGAFAGAVAAAGKNDDPVALSLAGFQQAIENFFDQIRRGRMKTSGCCGIVGVVSVGAKEQFRVVGVDDVSEAGEVFLHLALRTLRVDPFSGLGHCVEVRKPDPHRIAGAGGVAEDPDQAGSARVESWFFPGSGAILSRINRIIKPEFFRESC